MSAAVVKGRVEPRVDLCPPLRRAFGLPGLNGEKFYYLGDSVYFTLRPPTNWVQWTGSNYSQVRDFVSTFVSVIDLGDGSLLVGSDTAYPTDVISISGVVVPVTAMAGFYQPMENPGGTNRYLLEQDFPDLVNPRRERATATVPALSLGQTTNLSVTWPTAMDTADYDVTITPNGSSTLVGAVQWTVTSQSTTGCTIAVKSNIVSLSVGAIQLKVVAQA